LGQELVLVVEDEPMIRAIIAESLFEAGLRVLEAETADEALAILDSGSPVSSMITDVRMPGSMDGLDLAQLVASRWKNISLLVISGHASVNDPRMPAKAAFLAKPFTQDSLLTHVLSN
jgi:DNA-binding NtrC family response regulator